MITYNNIYMKKYEIPYHNYAEAEAERTVQVQK